MHLCRIQQTNRPMTSFRIRPRFQFRTKLSPDEIRKRISSNLERGDKKCYAVHVNHHIFLRINKDDLHYWSPQLDLTCDMDEEGTLVRGLYGPSPHVWTFFMFGYLALAVSALFIGMYGMSLHVLDQPSGILWGLPVLGLLAAGLYIASQMGQKIGAEQTFDLHHFLEDALGEDIHVH